MHKIKKVKQILNYTDYKIQQALWLQTENSKNTCKGVNMEQFCLIRYMIYLDLCSVPAKVQEKIRVFYVKLNVGIFDNGKFDKKVADNINKLGDSIISTYKKSVPDLPKWEYDTFVITEVRDKAIFLKTASERNYEILFITEYKSTDYQEIYFRRPVIK